MCSTSSQPAASVSFWHTTPAFSARLQSAAAKQERQFQSMRRAFDLKDLVYFYFKRQPLLVIDPVTRSKNVVAELQVQISLMHIIILWIQSPFFGHDGLCDFEICHRHWSSGVRQDPRKTFCWMLCLYLRWLARVIPLSHLVGTSAAGSPPRGVFLEQAIQFLMTWILEAHLPKSCGSIYKNFSEFVVIACGLRPSWDIWCTSFSSMGFSGRGQTCQGHTVMGAQVESLNHEFSPLLMAGSWWQETKGQRLCGSSLFDVGNISLVALGVECVAKSYVENSRRSLPARPSMHSRQVEQ